MGQYLLATYSEDSTELDDPPAEAPGGDQPPSAEAMQETMQSIIELEAAMDAAGAFVFGGHLHGPDTATVVRASASETLLTDGPFAESKEHMAGFYIINASDLDDALQWAGRVSGCIGRPIEVQPFAGTGRVADQMPGF